MIRKDFKQGDIVVATSHRDPKCCYINDLMWTCKFDRDISLDEAKQRHLENINREYPGLKITMAEVEKVLESDPNAKYFLNTAGDVLSYENHELADVFDLRFLLGESKEALIIEKEEWIKDGNIQPDPDGCYRCYSGIEDIDTSGISTEPVDIEILRKL